VDAMLCSVRADSQKSQVMGPRPLRMRLGMVTAMAKVIEYYVPEKFRKQAKRIPPKERGKIIQFPEPEKKSA